MTKLRTEDMVNRMHELQEACPDIEASAIVSLDGLMIASHLPPSYDDDRVSAMSAAMQGLGERIAEELGRGGLQQVYVRGESGYVVLTAVGDKAVFTVLAAQNAKLGLIFLEIKRAASDLNALLQ